MLRRKLGEAVRAEAISEAGKDRQTQPTWLGYWGRCHKGRASRKAILVQRRFRTGTAGSVRTRPTGPRRAATLTAAPEDVEATVAEEDTEDTRSHATLCLGTTHSRHHLLPSRPSLCHPPRQSQKGWPRTWKDVPRQGQTW